MTEKEALELRKNGSKLYNAVRVALFTTAAAVAYTYEPYEPDSTDARDIAHEIAEHVWHNSRLDDTFHQLSSQGYRQLIQDGWNPYVVNDPNSWQPSPDCVDNPTTRGGVAI